MNKKILCAVLAAGLIAGGLASCGKTNSLDEYLQYDLAEYITLPDYKNMEITVEESILTEERIQAELQSPRYYYSKTVEVTDRGAAAGDTAEVCYEAYCDGVNVESQHIELEIGSGTMPEAFENALIGLMTGEETSLKIAYPEGETAKPEYAGKTVTYTITLDKLTEVKVPAYTDDFVRGYLGFDSIAAYETAVRTNLEEYYADLNAYLIGDQLWTDLVANTTVLQYPEKELQEYIDSTITAHKDFAEANDLGFTDYVTTYHKMTVDEFYESIEEDGRITLKDEMISYAIARAENITLSDAEYTERATAYAKDQYDMDSLKEFEETYGKDTIYRIILCDKVTEWLTAEASSAE